MKRKVYRLIDHTADLGMEVFGRDLSTLYTNAGIALFDILVQGPEVRNCEQHSLHMGGIDRADLMVNWLRELLYLWNGRQQVVQQSVIEDLSETYLDAKVMTTNYDTDRHHILREIKAVTYHRIAVAQSQSGWRSQVFFDV